MRKVEISIIYPIDPFGLKVGGAGTFIRGFIKYAPEDFDVDFIGITSNYKDRPPKKWMKLKFGNKEFVFFPLLFEKNENMYKIVPLSFRFTLALKNSQVVFFNKVLFLNRIEPAILFRKVKFPKIVVVHNDIQKWLEKGKSEVLWSRFPWLYYMFEKFIFSFLDYIYTVSKNSLKFYKSKYPGQREKFEFLPTWVDMDLFHPIEEPKVSIKNRLSSLNKSLPVENKWILFAGRLQEQKAPKRLIDTFLECYKIDEKVSFIIIGEGNLRKEVEKYVKKIGLENNISFLGAIKQEKLADFYRASDVFLLTSNFEGMPISVLEALGCGLPVVTTNVGEVNRIVRNKFSGEVVDSFSPKVICQFVKKVLNNPKIYSIGNCVDAISQYTPHMVLKPVYKNIRNLFKESCGLK